MAEIQAMSMAGFLSGHGHLFSEEEQALIRSTPSNDVCGFSWSPLPPLPMLALAVHGARFVGGISLRRSFAPGESAVVEPMNVLPDYQRQGVGTRLWDFVWM